MPLCHSQQSSVKCEAVHASIVQYCRKLMSIAHRVTHTYTNTMPQDNQLTTCQTSHQITNCWALNY